MKSKTLALANAPAVAMAENVVNEETPEEREAREAEAAAKERAALEERIAGMPTDTGAQRAAKRLAEKRVSNLDIPTLEGEMTRQQRRHNARAAEKAMSKHLNEHVKGKNRKKTSGR